MKLSDPISALSGVGPAYLLKLKKLGIHTIEDLLFHIPHRHIDFTNKVSIRDLKIGEVATITGQVMSIQNVYTRTGKVFQVAKVSDGISEIEAVWMRQPWIVNTLPVDTYISLSGKLSFWGKKRAMMFPEYEKYSAEALHTGRLVPIYPETEGLSSKWLRKVVLNAIRNIEIDDFLDNEETGLLHLKDSLKNIHLAENKEEFEEAYKRLAFNELLMLQIENNLRKLWWRENTKSHILKTDALKLDGFIKSLPFELTSAQLGAIEELSEDLNRDIPMNRLLEGDVGSGKTVVAAAGAFISYQNSKKAIFMAPTQILAEQHYQSLGRLLAPFNIEVSLVTSEHEGFDHDKSQVIVGTHALLYREDLVGGAAFLVIDEQHRFGVKQRAKIAELAKGDKVPHTLTMTATPIPRTIALTLYGDLDLSTLGELPKGRKKIKTWVVPPSKRRPAEKWIQEQITASGAQVFVVCPIIDESESEVMADVKAATKEFERIQKIFPKFRVALLHGKMKIKEKNIVLDAFREKKYDILVSTPVIEVGIDIPNATIMVIEAAERFGLAQIHQLRGRVGRGDKDSYCLLFSESKSSKVRAKLKAVSRAATGKELAELDLETRGPGELLGVRQSGSTELKIARWNDFEMIIKSKEFAEKVVNNQEKYNKVLSYYRSKQKAPN